MKIICFNARGIASRVKWRAIKELVCQEKADMLLVQETKLQDVDNRLCTSIWGDANCEWRFIPASNRAGGILSIWRSGAFHPEEVHGGGGFLGLVGVWENQSERCAIVNVYSPCSIEGKRVLWRELLPWKAGSNVRAWCVARDFNVVRCVEERKGIGLDSAGGRREMVEFNEFIEGMEVVDIPLNGRKYTWYMEGATLSGKGSICTEGKTESVEGELEEMELGSVWQCQREEKELVNLFNELDLRAEDEDLSAAEVRQRQTLLAEFWKISKMNESLLQQKSRTRWIREGDSNSKYFHALVNWRRKTNSIVGLTIDGNWSEDPIRIKKGVKDFFEARF
ncbi:uncharacterized protein LOC130722842 [Lotus japonicus]|uniref:uncharacterized protein LOC130722842 n=1 Tax=Lotus japonicus TaxID=34305 RepID=UPI002586178E|nr:uncharacterized protein LOC130722842 [Lotus japonicus]